MRALFLIFGLIFLCGGASSTRPQQRVLLLHSYAPPMNWVTTITESIEAELLPETNGIDLRLEYMDTKRHFSPEYLANFKTMLALKYKSTPFDLIIASDNNAYDFIRLQRDTLFAGTPVVFCGVNGFDSKTMEGLADFTGVAEVYAPKETVELMLQLHPETREIFIINDCLTTGRQVRLSMEDELAALSDRVHFIHNEDIPLSELKQQLANLKTGQLALLGVYFGDSQGIHSTFSKMGEELQASCPVPMYCLLDFNLTGGLVGGRVTGAGIQGRAAAAMAARILDGQPADEVPTRPDGAFVWAFSHQALQRWDIDPSLLPTGHIVLHEPISFFVENRNLVLSTMAIFAALFGAILILVVNIKRRQKAEADLSESENDLSTTLTSIGDGVIATESNGLITRLNPVAEELLGWSEAEAQGKHLTEVFRLRVSETAPPGPPVDLSFETVLRSGETVTIARGTILITRDGSEKLIADSGAPIRSGDGETRGVVIVFRDVTEQMHTERRLQQAQKMESVGQLAGGIAHDFNNMLTGIIGYAELLQIDLQDNDEQLESVSRILQAGERASDLTHKLLDFSRKGKVLSTPLDMHEVIRDALSLLERTVGQSVTMVAMLGAERVTLVGDPTQLQQAVMNLCINARDAMPDGGTIRIATEVVDLSAVHCTTSAFDLVAGPHLRLSVSDTGTGIPAAVRDRIFEPFYTTKERGRGTGLGLAAVYGCIKAHRGAIHLSSIEKPGTTFVVDLPLHDMEILPVSEPVKMPENVARGTVLVVDDDDTVRSMAIDLLGSMGYEVISAIDGADGLEKFAAHLNEIDVVLLDLVMPRLGGRPAFHSMRRLDPHACVVLASGFAEPDAVKDLLENGLCGFLNKPYRRAELMHAMENARLKRRASQNEG